MDQSVHFMKVDVTDDHQVEKAFTEIGKNLGVPRILINCAGINQPSKIFRIDKSSGRAVTVPLASFRRVVEVNLLGTLNTIRHFAARCSAGHVYGAGDNGVIISTASVAAYEAPVGQSAYGASKAGVAYMTPTLARELARYGIRVLAVAPGAFDTSMLASVPDNIRHEVLSDNAFPKRAGRPEEFAHMIMALIGNEMMNGSVVRIDGGLRLQ